MEAATVFEIFSRHLSGGRRKLTWVRVAGISTEDLPNSKCRLLDRDVWFYVIAEYSFR
jgi:hypothetical protein